MDDGGSLDTVPVTVDAPPPAPAAVRAVMRIALRHGKALPREAAEQIVEAVRALESSQDSR